MRRRAGLGLILQEELVGFGAGLGGGDKGEESGMIHTVHKRHGGVGSEMASQAEEQDSRRNQGLILDVGSLRCLLAVHVGRWKR